MDFFTYPSSSFDSSVSLSSSSSSSSSSSFRIWVGRVRNICSSVVSAALGNLFSAIFIFFFAAVGSLLGAMTGAMIGQETESGFFRGAAVGAISGAVFSIEVFEYSLVLWHSEDNAFGCLFYLIDVIASLLSGRLVREQVGPAMLSAVTSQMDATETSFEEVLDIFETGGVKGLSGDSVEKIPKIKITRKNNVDASGDCISCSVCLQDFQLGETVRSLPHCHHMFHLSCIDKWLVKHGGGSRSAQLGRRPDLFNFFEMYQEEKQN
ncbi:zinc finger protein [Macleaya cordata]|uniref:Zinc finger protein n=1 Tax=Macleaya cordata TaxID=56857 RepID=A0A200QZR0_MACCD|nr:zinc finger protein [Macleaya cordata]